MGGDPVMFSRGAESEQGGKEQEFVSTLNFAV